ncbi:MAG: Uncharacterized protein YczJ, partial [uncultured Rubrobacteraceae bacterium]
AREVHPARALAHPQRPHRGLPRLGSVRGLEAPAPPLLRPFSHRGALRAGRPRGSRSQAL